MGVYLTASSAELELAEGIAEKEFPNSYSLEECVIELDSIATRLAAKDNALLKSYPALKRIKFAADFPKSENEITNNIFSVISSILISRFSNSADRGAVNTPYELAYDMVVLALASKLHRHHDGGITESYQEIKANKLNDEQKQFIASLSWLDPCVGTGVFALATINLLKAIGVADDIKFTGYDIDPLAVEVSKIRVAYNLSNGSSDVFRSMKSKLDDRFIHANSLEANGMQNSILNGSSASYDLVVGNPPYVRANRLTTSTKNQLKSQYSTIYHGTADLYVYFIASAINSLKDDGVVCFVSPAHFMKSNYGKTIRNYISKNAVLDVFIDFNELEVFKGISSHICVYVLSNGPYKATFSYLYDRLPVKDYLTKAVKNMSLVPKDNINPEGWNMHPYDVSELLNNIFSAGVSLREYVGNIYSGIKTGNQSVYVIGSDLGEKLLADEKSKSFIKPYIAPRKINQWFTPESTNYLIVIKKGDTVPDDSLLMNYLLENKTELEKRDDISDKKHWYALRDCSYYELFEQPKIIYPDISKINRFSIDYKNRFITDGAFFLPTSNLFLLGILNSSLAHFYFKLKLSGLGTAGNGGRIRFKKVYVENFPLPQMNAVDIKLIQKIEKLVSKHLDNFSEKEQAELDELVYNVYNVSSDIKELVEEKLTA